MKDYGQPTKPRPCECENPLADPREMTCCWCGRQVAGVPISSGSVARALGDCSSAARKGRKYRPAQ